LLNGLGLPLFTASAVSLRQTIVPSHLLGRVIASGRLVTWGALPAGALLGGMLGETIGLHETLIVAAIGACVVGLAVARSSIPEARAQPAATTPAAALAA